MLVEPLVRGPADRGERGVVVDGRVLSGSERIGWVSEKFLRFLLHLLGALSRIERMFDQRHRLEELRAQTTEALRAEYGRLDVLEAQVRAERLLVLSVLDERGVEDGDGALDTAGWVSAESRVRAGTARDEVRVARVLRARPEVAEAALAGELSRDELVRLARPERAVTPEEGAARQQGQRFWWKSRRRAGRLQVFGDFGDIDGAKFVKALERHAEQIGKREDGTWAPFEERCAEALIALASGALAEDARPRSRDGRVARTRRRIHGPAPARV